jgi:manganese/zinc/iron transport system permease protein
MNWTLLDTWIVITGMLCAASCALLGSFLVLRKMSMMGDAISHAVLPGLAIAFLLTGSRASWPMFVGAAVVGILTALFTEWIRGFGKVDEGASMGVVFTALFAIGLILVVQSADKVDLDPGCVLYGAIELVVLDTLNIFGFEIPRAAAMLSIVLAVNLSAVLLFYKELKISSFDPALATTLGINARFMHYLLMTLVAVTTVASFESVGSILVVAMLIAPAAAAHMLTDRLSAMLLVSVIIGLLSAVLGHVGAIEIPRFFGRPSTTTAGMMAAAAGLLFAIAVLAAPRHGVIVKLIHRLGLTLRIVREDILAALWRMEEQPQNAGLAQFLASLGFPGKIATNQLLRAGQIARQPYGLALTDSGRTAARSILRSHRLWETYLVREVMVRPDHSHSSAERLEHVTGPALQERLTETLTDTTLDPQGKPIPPQ